MSGSQICYLDENGLPVHVTAANPLPIGGAVTQTPVVLTLTVTDVSDADSIAAGSRWLSVTNTGETDGTFAGATLAAGATETITAPSGTSLGAIAYDASDTTFRIRTLA